ncbi:MAG TPA: ROK family protein [Ktedonobacteraceae bacterium]|jgi:glucokinase
MDDTQLQSMLPEAFIGIDIGGTSTRIALFESLADTHSKLIARFPTYQSYEHQRKVIISTLNTIEAHHIAGIGVSLGGRMARDGRSLGVAPNLPDYVGKPFAADLEREYACPIRLAHDPVCGLLAEVRFGTLRDAERAAYLTLSTGTGAAVYLHKGSTSLALSIEVGHQILDGNERLCLCGQTGCLETYTGGRQLELRLGGPLSSLATPDVWESLCRKLALGLVNLTQLTRVEVIAVSGAIALNNPAFLARVQLEINTLLCGSELELRWAQLEENAPLIGAVQLLSLPDENILH